MIKYEIFTDKGDREVNEDNVRAICNGTDGCFIVCDGLGGHGRGDEASEIVSEEILRCYKEFGNDDDFIENAFESAQSLLLAEQKERNAPMQMKTTAVVLTVSQSFVRWGYIGDSRLYMFKNSRLKTRTLDHSVPQMLVLAKDIKEKDIRFHPDRNKLLKVLGSEWGKNPYEISEKIKLKKGMAFLLCTDGFWEFIDEKQICALLKKQNSDWLNQMVCLVKENGHGNDMDNFSAITVTV